jgi:cytochrome P450
MAEPAQQLNTNIFHPEYDRRRSYEVYAKLRKEGPLARLENTPMGTLWLVTRYDDVVAILKDERFVKNWRSTLPKERIAQLPPLTEVERLLTHHMLDLDPPDHTRLRALVSKGFTPRIIEGLRDRVQAIADELLDAVQDKGQMDLVDDYAFQVPIVVIAEMLGAPIADRHRFREWSDLVVTPILTEEAWLKASASLTEFIAYMRNMFEERRRAPREDLITALVQAENEAGALHEDELYSMVMLLLVAGHETTVNLIANGIVALLQHPDQLAKLRSTPSLIKTAVEELLRFDGPVETSTSRWAREDVVFDGTLIKKGEGVLVVLAGADHDPKYFDQPEVLDITRAVNRHVAFGQGIHFCIGAPLARMEGQIAIDTLLRRMPRLALGAPIETLSWKPGMLLRGYTKVPVTF